MSKQKIKAFIPHLKISDNRLFQITQKLQRYLNPLFRVLSLFKTLTRFLQFLMYLQLTLLLMKRWCLKNYSSSTHLRHLVQMEFILIPLRNVQVVYVGQCVCCSTNHFNLVCYPKTGNMLTSFLSSIKELHLKPAITDQSVSLHKLLKSWNLSCVTIS